MPEFSFGLEVDTPYCMRAVLLRLGSRRCAYDWKSAEIPIKVWTGNGPTHYMDMTVKRSEYDSIAVIIQITPEQFIRTCKTGAVDPLKIDGNNIIIGSLMVDKKQIKAEANDLRRALSSRVSFNLNAVYLATVLVPVPKGAPFREFHNLEDSSAQMRRYVTNTKITTDLCWELPTVCVQISIMSFPQTLCPFNDWR